MSEQNDAKAAASVRRGRVGSGEAVGTRAKLLLAASQLFADRGYKSVSIREISASAGVNSALVNYHFGSKQGLFEEVIRLYTADHIADRMVRLADERRRQGRLKLEDLLAIYLDPLIDPVNGPDAEGIFARLHSVMIAERMEGFEQIATRAFTTVNLAFIEELEKCLPHLQRKTIAWRLFAIIGAMLYFDIRPSPPGLMTISGGACDPADRNELRRHLMRFFIDGMRAPVE